MKDVLYDWKPESMLEVTLPNPDSFLKICETLTRIGIASQKEKKLTQSCYILHKQGKYFIVHFLEMFILDGRYSTLTLDDVARRNRIALLLEEWNLLTVVNKDKNTVISDLAFIKIVPYKDKSNWTLVQKYKIGGKK